MSLRSRHITTSVIFLIVIYSNLAARVCNVGRGSKATDGINKLTVYCNNETSMRLTWTKSYGATSYNIRIIEMNSDCLSYNVTDEEFVFDNEKHFIKGTDYWILVTPFPRPDIPLPSLANAMLVGSCPKIGEWTVWSNWGMCQSKGCNENGKRYRSRDCKRRTTNGSFDPVACQPPIEITESQPCWKDCAIKSCQNQAFTDGIKVEKVLVYCTAKSQKEMRLTWEKVHNAVYYMVMMSDNQQNCALYNVTDEELIFNPKMSFVVAKDYWGLVTAFQSNKIHQTTIKSAPTSTAKEKAMYFGSCPKIGKWSEWGDWGACQSEVCDDTGKRYRSKDCLKNGTGKEIQHVHCEPPWEFEQGQTCLKKCGIATKIITRFSTRPPTIVTLRSTSGDSNNYYGGGMSSFLGIIIGSTSGVLVLIVLVVLVCYNRKYKRRRSLSRTTASESWPISLYVSHRTERNKESHMLSLVQYITSFGIHCTVDLLSQVNINNMGGLANWLPSQIRSADKILVVLSKAYLKALHSFDDSSDAQICKIHSEFHYIKSLMYQSLQRVQLVIILDGVKSEEIPDEFRGRFYCKFPKNFEKEDNSCCQLMGLLLDEEPLIIDARDVSFLQATESRSSTTSSGNPHEQRQKKSSDSPSTFPLLVNC